MPTKLIQLKDSTLIEIQVSSGEAEKISGGFASRVDSTVETIKPLLIKVCRPITDAWEEVNQKATLEQAEVEIGLAFETEGNLYITKSTATANIKVKLILKPMM